MFWKQRLLAHIFYITGSHPYFKSSIPFTKCSILFKIAGSVPFISRRQLNERGT